MLAPNTTLRNRYQIVRQLGQGGMGAVYLATDQTFGSTVALKETLISDEHLRKAFEREARLLNSLRHAGLPHVFDYFFEGDGQFLVMQFIPGEDLGQQLKRYQRPFAPDDVLRWADQLLDLLDYLHTHEPPIIHRDIKPENLKLTQRGDIILLDFGLAKGSTDQMTQVSSKSLFGYTPHYAPFEQIRGTGTDPRSDLYSLAATLFHLLSGKLPPDALTRAESVLNGEPDPLGNLPALLPMITPQVAGVLQRALAQKRDHRHASAAAMRAELREAVKAIPATVKVAPPNYIQTMVEQPTPPPFPAPHVPSVHPSNPPAGPVTPSQPPVQQAYQQQPSYPPPPTPQPQYPIQPSYPSAPPTAHVPQKSSGGNAKVLIGLVVAAVIVLAVAAALVIFVLPSLMNPSGTNVNSNAPVANTNAPANANTSTGPAAPVKALEPSGALSAGGPVFEVAVSPDGQYVVSARESTAVSMWQASAGSLTRDLSVGAGASRALAFSPDGTYIAAGDDDGGIYIWKTADGSEVRTIAAHEKAVFLVDYDGEGRRFATAGNDGSVKIWNATDDEPEQTITAPSADHAIVHVSSDLRNVAFYNRKTKDVEIWSVGQNRRVAGLARHTYTLSAGVFSPDGSLLALGSPDGTVRVWKSSDGSAVREVKSGAASISSLRWSPDGALLVTGSDDGKVRLWKADGTMLSEAAGHKSSVATIAFSADGTSVATGGKDGQIKLWSVVDKKP
jgi:serine/threonine protein kinase